MVVAVAFAFDVVVHFMAKEATVEEVRVEDFRAAAKDAKDMAGELDQWTPTDMKP